MKRKGSYHSELRAEQVAATRERIVEAAAGGFASWIADRPLESVPFDKVAERARVSVRTVFRYFPTQRDLVSAVGVYFEQQMWGDANEVRAENIGAMTARAFEYFGSLIEGGDRGPGEGLPGLLAEYRAKRLAAVERALAPCTEGMDDELARGLCAVFSGLLRVQFFRAMHEHWGLDGAQAGRAVEWVMNALIDDLKRKKEEEEEEEEEECGSKPRSRAADARQHP